MGTCITMFSLPKVKGSTKSSIADAAKQKPRKPDIFYIAGEEYLLNCHLHRDSLADGKSKQTTSTVEATPTACFISEDSLESVDFEACSSSLESDANSMPDSLAETNIKLTDMNELVQRSLDLLPNFNFERENNLRSCREFELVPGQDESLVCKMKSLCQGLSGTASVPDQPKCHLNQMTNSRILEKNENEPLEDSKVFDTDGSTLLHWAASRGHYHKTSQLIKSGAKVNVRNGMDRTPLHEVAIKGHVSIAKLLLENGARVNSRDVWRMTPLHQAITWKQSRMVRLLLQYGAREKGTHLLQDVIMSNMDPLEDIVRKLIDRGANVNATDMTGQSPIHTAVRYGYGNIVQLLLNAGADVNKVSRGILDRNHTQVLKNARMQLVPLKLDVLLQDGWSPLRIAQKRKRYDLVVWLLTCGANVVVCDNMGRFPHHKATTQRNCPTMHHILAHPNCPIDIKDIEGSSAIKLNFEDHAKSMVDSQSACNCCRNQYNGDDPEQIPSCDKYANATILLIQHGADLRDLYIHGYDLLYHLCSSKFSYDLHLLQAVLHSGNNLSELLANTAPSCLNSLYRQNRLDMHDWLYEFTNNPRPLRDLCRHQIRSHLRDLRPGRSIWTAVTSLPLPHQMMDFLLLQEFQRATVTRHFSEDFPKHCG